jgi:acyl-CoA dehydrogenase
VKDQQIVADWQLWDFPFFEPHHRALAEAVSDWPEGNHDVADMAAECRRIARELAARGLLEHVVPHVGEDGSVSPFDVRALCIIREVLGDRDLLADSVFGMQGIGTGAIWMHGTPRQREKYLAPVREGRALAGFALSEPEAGSDVASMTTSARRDGDGYVINGVKTWITNAPFADHYIVVARTGEAPGSRGLSAFVVDAGTPGLSFGPAIDLIAPHPAASVVFEDCRVPADAILGEPGQGFKVTMGVFDIFRTSVGAAAVGAAGRALRETLARVGNRKLFGRRMAEMEGVQFRIADMTVDLELAALSVYRAAWMRDTRPGRATREVSIAKLAGSEAAGRILDAAVQLHGGMGVTQGSIIERLYRDVRPMRLYEGASEVQKLIIARAMLGLSRS